MCDEFNDSGSSRYATSFEFDEPTDINEGMNTYENDSYISEGVSSDVLEVFP